MSLEEFKSQEKPTGEQLSQNLQPLQMMLGQQNAPPATSLQANNNL